MNSHTLRYHRSAYGLPPITLPRLADLKLTEHVKVRAAERGVPLNLLTTFDPTTYPVFQVEVTEAGEVVSFNYRKRMDSRRDYCAVVSPSQRCVISTWVQWATFIPFIDRTAYARPVHRALCCV